MSKEILIAACKELKQVGTSKATDDALRFMYANLLAFEMHLSTTPNSIDWPIPELFEQLAGDTDTQIREKYLQLRAKNV